MWFCILLLSQFKEIFEDTRRKHSGEKPYKCNQCNYASSRADHLTMNLKRHSGETSKLVCNYLSSQVCSLRTHLKIHIGKKSNNCNQCDYSSFLEEDLRKHLKTFRGEMLKTSPQAKRHQPSLLITPITSLFQLL